jgi:predicted PurR-regulated permease PerM
MNNAPSSQASSAPLNDEPPQWEKGARYLAAAFLVITTALLLLGLVPVISMVAMGFIIAFLIYIPIRAVMRRGPGIHYSFAVVVFYVLIVLVTVVLLYVGISHLVDGVSELSISFEDARAELEIPENELTGQLLQALLKILAAVIQAMLSLTSGVAGLVGVLVSALLFSFFLMLDLNRGRGVLVDWVPPEYHREITLLLSKLDGIWVGYITAQVIYGSLLAAFSLVEFTLLGVPFPLVMAIMTGIISLIPTIGGLLSSAIVASFCLIFGSSVLVDMSNATFALLVVVIGVVITQVTYNFIALPIVGRYVQLPVSVVFVGVLAGLALGSIVLAFLVVPILATLRIFGSYILSKVMGREPFPDETVPERPQPGFFSQLFVSSFHRTE